MVLSVITLNLLPTYFFVHLFAFVPVLAFNGNMRENMRWRRRKNALQYCYKIKWHHFSSASAEIVSFLSWIACVLQSIVCVLYVFNVAEAIPSTVWFGVSSLVAQCGQTNDFCCCCCCNNRWNIRSDESMLADNFCGIQSSRSILPPNI